MTQAGQIVVSRVDDSAGMAEFIDFVYRLRAREPHWVPPLRRDIKVLLDRKKHPFHQHATVDYFLARRDGRTVGRIAAIENNAHNDFHAEKVGFFGFLDAENDPDVFRELLRAAEDWARARGLTALRGPGSFSSNEEWGLLIDGFDCDPAIMMPFHPPHYQAHIEAAGYAKAKDLFAWWLSNDMFTQRVRRLAEMQKKRFARNGVTYRLRSFDPGRFREEVDLVKAMYNKAWEKNWGFVPMTDAEMEFTAKELRPIVDPRIVIFLECEGKPAGFLLSLPDYNVVLKHMDGRLGPIQILLALLLKPHIKHLRLLMLGMLPEYRNRGFEILLYAAIAEACKAAGMPEGELGWTLEDNDAINNGIRAMGGRIFKTYRVYEKALA